MLHDKHSKLDYIQAKKNQYRKARRGDRETLLTEAASLTGYSRHYAAVLLRTHHDLTKASPKQRRLRTRKYGPGVTDVVLAVRRALSGACGELVQPALLTMTDKLVAVGELARPSPETMVLLGHVSLSTVKRVFKEDHDRSYEHLKLHGGMTTPGKLLKAQVAEMKSRPDSDINSFTYHETKRKRDIITTVISVNALEGEEMLPTLTGSNHWCIENNLHWTKDEDFYEDKHTLRLRKAPQVMSWLRSMVISLCNSLKLKSIRSVIHNLEKSNDLMDQFLRMTAII